MTRACIAPLSDGRLCGAPAVTTRSVESLDCALCAAHAAEMDDDMTTTTIAVTSLRSPSRLIDTDGEGTPVVGSVDAELVVDGGHYGVTLRPDHTGDLDSWGSLDHWLSVGAGGRDLSRDEQHAVIDAVKAAAKAAA